MVEKIPGKMLHGALKLNLAFIHKHFGHAPGMANDPRFLAEIVSNLNVSVAMILNLLLQYRFGKFLEQFLHGLDGRIAVVKSIFLCIGAYAISIADST